MINTNNVRLRMIYKTALLIHLHVKKMGYVIYRFDKKPIFETKALDVIFKYEFICTSKKYKEV